MQLIREDNPVMNPGTAIALLLFLALSSWAQPLSSVEVSPIIGADGTVTIQNHHSRPITALLLRFALYEGFNRHAVIQPYVDVYVNHDAPILPGGSRALPVTSSRNVVKFRSQLTLAGVIFDDGSTEGSADGLRILSGRRRYLSDVLAQHEAVAREMESLGVSETISRVESIRAAAEDQVRAKKLDPDVTILVGGLVSTWLKSSIANGDLRCDASCVAARSRFVLAGLVQWRAHAAKGLAESAAAGF